MRDKFLYATPWAATLVLITSVVATAQTVEVSGKITLKRPGGGVVPVLGAQIDIYRTDFASKAEATTDARGDYIRPGLASLGTYTIAVSARGARPEYRAGLRLTSQPIQNFTLVPGDGSRLTLDQIRASASNQNVAAQNAEITRANEILARTFKAGNEALSAANLASKSNNPSEAINKFTVAIAQYDEALAADADQPAILVNKAVALKGRGVERFNAAVKSRDPAASQLAKNDFRDAAETSRKAVTMIKAQAQPTDQAEAAKNKSNKYAALLTYAESMRLYVSKVNSADAGAGAEAYKDYLSVEADPKKKIKARLDLAQMLLDVGQGGAAAPEFRAVLAEEPDNLSANLGLGLALFSTGDKTKAPEAAKYIQRFVDLAPDSHPLKSDAKLVLMQLKNQ